MTVAEKNDVVKVAIVGDSHRSEMSHSHWNRKQDWRVFVPEEALQFSPTALNIYI